MLSRANAGGNQFSARATLDPTLIGPDIRALACLAVRRRLRRWACYGWPTASRIALPNPNRTC
jgi:hypothetical protein